MGMVSILADGMASADLKLEGSTVAQDHSRSASTMLVF
jgi:hypothetical protein